MMSRPLVKSIAIDQDDDSSTASNSPAFKPEGEPPKKNSVNTVWKFHPFSVTQILREINFGGWRSSKNAVFAIFWALNC